MNRILSRLNTIAQRAAQRSDVVIAMFIVLAVVMMIIPLPTSLVDALIGVNIGFSLLILIVAFYISHPVEYSSLPPIILLATLFRLALSITTTRLILLEGNAGQIVSAFGNFVIAGEVVIGLVVFLIITVAQFLVITKGAERVAEVAARFILDGMPGKQMSIDNDVRNGHIDQEEARIKRSRLERESQLYGSMDGAMKFVKGDAIAGLVILCVNLIGGLLIGMLKRDMPFGEAVNTYSLLTVGDGLIAQIPALLIAVAAGTVVTRVNSDQAGDLGSEIVAQLGSNSRALGLTATILFFAAFIPGFATGVFLFLAAGLGLAAWWVRRRYRREHPEDSSGESSAPSSSVDSAQPSASGAEALASGQQLPTTQHRLVVSLGSALAEEIPLDSLRGVVDATRQRVASELGIDIPAVGVRSDAFREAQGMAIELDEVPVLEGEVPADHVLLDDDPMHLELLEVEYLSRPSLTSRASSHWVDAQSQSLLDEAGIGYQLPQQVLCQCLERVLTRYAGEFVGIQETRSLLSQMEQDYSELVGEAVRVVSLQKMADVLRRLVEEGVPLRALRTILEAMVTWGAQEQSVGRLVERIRGALARQICHRYARNDRVLPAWVITRQLEETIRSALRDNDGTPRTSNLPVPLSRSLNNWFQHRLSELDADVSPVIVASSDVRPVLQQWVNRHHLDLPVMSWQEIAAEFNLQALAQVRLPTASTQGGTPSAAASRE
ncbi:type III secretion system export apparatus subunit SctV [Halomonas binhaiensis]|uniref:Type III secretion system export apparatus subunit SctV n=1 Tax=Halomonas binhaiensis TaxID=2562282 RepID=A0A5C1NL93_9GAMM|nr:type III secretion system export apparatus subunit SctV [Halomonas binhaiensis]QEM82569.1 type III secretion system export apparatus subunit SctV [Halomonas binhaiensis]